MIEDMFNDNKNLGFKKKCLWSFHGSYDLLMSTEQVSRWMDKVDCEGSGRLTLQQFSDGLARKNTSSFLYHNLDPNHSGTFSLGLAKNMTLSPLTSVIINDDIHSPHQP